MILPTLKRWALLLLWGLSWSAGFGLAGNAGATPPVLVFQSGFGDGKAAWDSLLPHLPAGMPRYVHERPGNGDTPAVDTPRDPCSVAAELHAALQSQALSPPYLLVGHSLGGLYQYAFARLYPDEVAGMVLVDPTHRDNWQAIKDTMPDMAALIIGMKSVALNVSKRREFDEQTLCLERLPTTPLPMPAAFLFSGRPDKGAKAAFEIRRREMQADWLQQTGAQAIRVPYSGHYIQREAPAAVWAAIARLAGLPDLADGLGGLGSEHFDLLGRPAMTITAGVTRAEDIAGRWKKADEEVLDAGQRIWVFRDFRVKSPAYISWLPVIGDIADAAELVGQWVGTTEAIIELDSDGVVRRVWRRKFS